MTKKRDAPAVISVDYTVSELRESIGLYADDDGVIRRGSVYGPAGSREMTPEELERHLDAIFGSRPTTGKPPPV